MDTYTSQAEKWIEKRPFLRELGAIHITVHNMLDGIPGKSPSIPDWNAAEADFAGGVPVLKSVQLDLEQAEILFTELTNLSDNKDLPDGFRQQCANLKERIAKTPALPSMIIDSLINGGDTETLFKEQGVNRALAALFARAAVSNVLRPYMKSLAVWQEDHNWSHSYCPTCGCEAEMAQLKKMPKGRTRFLACGVCSTKWRYKRIGCPYCENTEQKQLGLLETEQEPDIRVDLCESCGGYLKTYTKDETPDVALEGWASIHLDIAVAGRKEKKTSI